MTVTERLRAFLLAYAACRRSPAPSSLRGFGCACGRDGVAAFVVAPRASLRASASALRQWRCAADACRYAARNSQACAPLALHFALRSQCLAWTFAPPLLCAPLLLCDGHTARLRRTRPQTSPCLARSACLRSLTLRVGHLRPTGTHSRQQARPILQKSHISQDDQVPYLAP